VNYIFSELSREKLGEKYIRYLVMLRKFGYSCSLDGFEGPNWIIFNEKNEDGSLKDPLDNVESENGNVNLFCKNTKPSS
jgi:hypothetical protein